MRALVVVLSSARVGLVALVGLIALVGLSATAAGAAEPVASTPTPDAPAAAAAAAMTTTTKKKKKEAATAPDSPRAALSHFLDHARHGRFDDAALYLEQAPAEGPRTVRRLRLLLDRGAAVSLKEVSPLSHGDPDDGLADDVDEVGELGLDDGLAVPVELVRVAPAVSGVSGVHWVFSSPTVARVDDAWRAVPHGALIERLPDVLLREGPLGLLRYQWLLLPLLLALSWFVGVVASRLLQALLRRLAARTRASWDDELVTGLRGPITLALTVAAAAALSPWIELWGRPRELFDGALRTGLMVAFFWALLRVVDVVVTHLLASPWSLDKPASRALVPLGGRIFKVTVVAIAAIAVISSFGYPVASLLAGLGIGGLAVALAAQKTFENLFGAFAVGVDQPFREGDSIKVDDLIGTVEAIGLRSTRIRTLDRTLVTLPNGQLAEKRIESFAERDRIRLLVMLNVGHATTSAQLQAVVAGLDAMIRAEPKVWPEGITARLSAIGPASLDIECSAWFDTRDFDEFAVIRSRLLLAFLRIVEESGAALAHPTRTVRLAETPAVASLAAALAPPFLAPPLEPPQTGL